MPDFRPRDYHFHSSSSEEINDSSEEEIDNVNLEQEIIRPQREVITFERLIPMMRPGEMLTTPYEIIEPLTNPQHRALRRAFDEWMPSHFDLIFHRQTRSGDTNDYHLHAHRGQQNVRVQLWHFSSDEETQNSQAETHGYPEPNTPPPPIFFG